MTLTMVAAAGENNELGKDNQLIWHLPDDFKRFKKITSHHHIIMGRKTFESFPKPLPNRIHVVITRQKDYPNSNCIPVSSLEKALATCPQDDENFIIGGGEIYKMALAIADKIELTRVHGTFTADTLFPELTNDWQLEKEEFHDKDQKHQYAFTYQTFIKKIELI